MDVFNRGRFIADVIGESELKERESRKETWRQASPVTLESMRMDQWKTERQAIRPTFNDLKPETYSSVQGLASRLG